LSDLLKENISKNLRRLYVESDLRKGDFEKLFNLSQGLLGKYLDKKVLPKIEFLVDVATHFGVSLDTLVSGTIDYDKENSKNYKVNTVSSTLNDSDNAEENYNKEGDNSTINEELAKTVMDSNKKITEVYNLLLKAENKMLLSKGLEKLNEGRKHRSDNGDH